MKKVIVITGGSEGIGREIARMLLPENIVVLLSRNKGKLEQTSRELACDFLVCDVSKQDEVEKTVEKIIKKHGRIDALVNNAGIWVEGKLENNHAKDIISAIEVNTLGTILFSKAVINQMKKQGKGQIVNVISQSGLIAKAERTVYNASKWAITGFTKSLRLELGGCGIGVTGVYPAKVNTKLFENAGIDKEMGHSIEPEDVAKAVQFALSMDGNAMVLDIGLEHVRRV